MKTNLLSAVGVAAIVGLAALAPGLFTEATAQQASGSQVIKIIVPFTPGTGADTLARTLGPKLANGLGKHVVVENRAGASGSIGTAAVASAEPDGGTFLMTANTIITNLHFQESVPYDPLKDFAPVGQLATAAFALMVNPSFPAKNLKEAIAVLKAAPGKHTYASPGVGTPQNVGMELFQSSTGTQMLHVPYKGSAGAVTDVLGGQIDMMVVPLHFALPYAEAGKVRLLGVAQPERAKFAPDVPTFDEQGVTGANIDTWFAMFAPAGTPSSIIEAVYGEVKKALASPDVLAVLEKQGLSMQLKSPEELAATMKSDYQRWGDLARSMKGKK